MTFMRLKSQKVGHLAICFDFAMSKFFSMGLKILKSSDFRAKNGFGLNFKAGMDATTAQESFATILGNGSGWMSKKFNDFDFSFGRHLFRVCLLILFSYG